jgi:hypothetical protein
MMVIPLVPMVPLPLCKIPVDGLVANLPGPFATHRHRKVGSALRLRDDEERVIRSTRSPETGVSNRPSASVSKIDHVLQ